MIQEASSLGRSVATSHPCPWYWEVAQAEVDFAAVNITWSARHLAGDGSSVSRWQAASITSGPTGQTRIAEKAGVGLGTVYRHFPQRSDLIRAVFQSRTDACADAASELAAQYDPGEALAKWMQRYVDFIATKRGLATALHSGDPAYSALPSLFNTRLLPALTGLLDSAVETGEIRSGVDAKELLHAVANLCRVSHDKEPAYSRRMVVLLVDGLRYGTKPKPKASQSSVHHNE